jgi:hypothetical protein
MNSSFKSLQKYELKLITEIPDKLYMLKVLAASHILQKCKLKLIAEITGIKIANLNYVLAASRILLNYKLKLIAEVICTPLNYKLKLLVAIHRLHNYKLKLLVAIHRLHNYKLKLLVAIHRLHNYKLLHNCATLLAKGDTDSGKLQHE